MGGVHEGFDVRCWNGGLSGGGLGGVLGEGFEGEGVEEVVTASAATAIAAVAEAAEEGEEAGEAGEDCITGGVSDGRIGKDERGGGKGNTHKEKSPTTSETSSPAHSAPPPTASAQ